MLIEFSVTNFRSIKNKVTFSMLASKSDKKLEDNLLKKKNLKDDFVRGAVIYGPNASGKSNLINSLGLLKRIIIRSYKNQKGDRLIYEPFKLNPKSIKEPTKFEVHFTKNKRRYSYSLEYNSKRIVKEELYIYPKNKGNYIFKRNNTSKFEFQKGDKKELDFISKRTLENVSFLSKIINENCKVGLDAFNWFKDDLQIIGAVDHPGLEEFTSKMLSKKLEKSKIMSALHAADLGIDEIKISKKTLKLGDLPKDFPDEIKSIIFRSKKEVETKEITTKHKGISFNFENEESEGTKKMYRLIGPIIDVLQRGRVLMIDELDTKLHHLLCKFIINLFHDKAQNKKEAQLIFATHNLQLLDQSIFRRDQIWFTEKQEGGETGLYSILEYKPRNDFKLIKGYLAGKFGALPFIQNSESLKNE